MREVFAIDGMNTEFCVTLVHWHHLES